MSLIDNEERLTDEVAELCFLHAFHNEENEFQFSLFQLLG